MAEYKISSAVASNLKAAMTDFAVDAQRTDGPSDQKDQDGLMINGLLISDIIQMRKFQKLQLL